MLRTLVSRTLLTSLGIAAVGLLNSVLLSRWLGPGGRGEIAAALLWPTLLVYLSSLGLISSILYLSASPQSGAGALFSNAMAYALVQGLIAGAIAYQALPWLLHSQRPAVVAASRLFLLVITPSLMTQYGLSILQGRMQLDAFNRLRTILPGGYLLGTCALMVVGRLTLLNIIVLHLILTLCTLGAVLWMLRRTGVRLNSGLDGQLGVEMLKYGLKTQVGDASQMANFRLDQVLMVAYLPPQSLGLYVVAVGVASVMQIPSLAVRMVLIPMIAGAASVEQRMRIVYRAFGGYWTASLCLASMVAMVLPLALPLLFGPAFKGATLVAEILLLGTLFLGAKDVLSGVGQALGNPWLSSRADLAALGVTIILLIALLPTFGIVGAAVASAAAYALELLFMVRGLRRAHAISPTGLFRVEFRALPAIAEVLTPWRGRPVA